MTDNLVYLRDLPRRWKFRYVADSHDVMRWKLGEAWEIDLHGEAVRLTSLELNTRVIPLGTY